MSDARKMFDPAIDRQAAEWFGRRQTGLTVEDERAFQRWLEADPRHEAHYRQFDETWALLDDLEHLPHLASETVQGDSRRNWRRRWATVSLAVAATIVLGLATWSRWAPEVVSYSVATAADGMKKLEFPDGSVVRLNAETSVKVELTSQLRRVMLERGEAYFTVAKDPSRPFVVHAEGVAVRAVGTAFNVALRPSGLEVLVTEGQVRVEDAANEQRSLLPTGAASETYPLLTSGRKATMARSGQNNLSPVAHVAEVPPAESERTLAWQMRLLEFDMQPLSAMVAEFNRYNQHQLEIADPKLADRRFGANFRADNYEAFVELLEKRFGVVAKREQGKTVLSLRR